MEFYTNKSSKRKLAFRRIPATTGGKVAMATWFIVAALCSILPRMVYDYALPKEGHSFDYGAAMELTAMVLGSLLVLLFLDIVCTYRQRNAGLAMRKNEALRVEGERLYYSFKPSLHRSDFLKADLAMNERNVVEIDLKKVAVSIDKSSLDYVFEGDGIRAHYYANVNEERHLDYDEMKPLRFFTIGAYFGKDFDDLMREYL